MHRSGEHESLEKLEVVPNRRRPNRGADRPENVWHTDIVVGCILEFINLNGHGFRWWVLQNDGLAPCTDDSAASRGLARFSLVSGQRTAAEMQFYAADFSVSWGIRTHTSFCTLYPMAEAPLQPVRVNSNEPPAASNRRRRTVM